MDTGYLWRLVRCLLLTALAVSSPAPVRAATDKPLVPPVPRTYLVRYLVFTISPAPGKDAWPDEAPAIFHESPPELPTTGSASFSAIELPFRSQLASREKAQRDLEELQRKDSLYRYDLVLWGEERCPNGGDCIILDGPTTDKWQTTVALFFAPQSIKPETVALRAGGKTRLSSGAMGGWGGSDTNLRLGKTYTKNAYGGIPLKQIMVAFSIVPGP